VSKIKPLALRLFDPIDIAPLVWFRIGFGGLMLWEVWRYFNFNRIGRYYVDTSYNFHYFGFQWLTPLPGDGMFWLFHLLGLLSVLIMLGAFYRISMGIFWLCFTYVFLLDKAQYLNHFYLISLISFLMIFVPAHRALSVDALLRPSLRAQVAPAWSLWLLRGQMAIVYFFGGLAKINPDWLAGEPMRDWMAARTDFPLIGRWFTEEWLVYLFSYGGLLLDLLIVPFLLWPRTRIPALLMATLFHLMNARLFNIGIFPWFAIAATLLFMPPHWFRLPILDKLPAVSPPRFQASRHGLILASIGVYFVIQIALPLRHWLYPGDPSWTEEGHTLAWRMRLRDKDGDIAFYASDPTSGSSWRLHIDDQLSARQLNQMKDNPPMILRFSHHLAESLRDTYPDVRIHARAMMSLNSRAPQLLIDPSANLANEPDDLIASDWIVPLVQQPHPAGPVPALLVSQRYPNVLLLINITESIYPLDDLVLELADYSLNTADSGAGVLLPGECLLVHTPSANLQSVFAPCNEVGTRLILPDSLSAQSPHINTGATTQLCDRPACVVLRQDT